MSAVQRLRTASCRLDPLRTAMTAALDAPEVLTVTEVAHFLRVNTKTIYALIRRGELRAFRVGRVVRCHRTDVLRFVTAQTEADSTMQDLGSLPLQPDTKDDDDDL